MTALAGAVSGRDAAGQRRQLTRLARSDVLTGVLNRRGFVQQFASADTRTPALVVFDLDGFKQVNDVHGHAAGDELLRWVAGTLSDGAGPGDLVGRLGGDEFVMLLHGDDPAGTAARLREALAARIGASVGVAVLGTDGDDFDGLYAVADARLYTQKRGITVSAARTEMCSGRPCAARQAAS